MADYPGARAFFGEVAWNGHIFINIVCAVKLLMFLEVQNNDYCRKCYIMFKNVEIKGWFSISRIISYDD